MVGSFTAVNSVGRVNFAAVDAVSGDVLPISADTDSFVYTVAATSNLVFIGGNFQNVSSQPRRFLAALDARTGVLTSWNSPADLFVKRMDIFDNSLYVAGAFGHLAGASTRSIGAYPLSLTGAPGIVPNSVQRSPNGNFQFRLTAGGVPQATVQVSSDLVTWQPLQSVPLIGGYGVFTDTNIPNAPQRFYRISVP
jgi:hypothetical protein